MKTLSFKYTKADNSISDRVLVTMVSPASMYEGIDISGLEPADMAFFEQDMKSAYTDYITKIALLKKEYDVEHNYRRFDPKKMTEIVTES